MDTDGRVICENYTRPAGVLGGPCLNCGGSQPEHVEHLERILTRTEPPALCTTNGRPVAEVRASQTAETGQHDGYIVLCPDERAKGFIRPYRDSYRHVGTEGPRHALIDVTADRYGPDKVAAGYVKFEAYPEGSDILGRYWTQAQLDAVGKACGSVTTMGRALSETYARQPTFYGATFCVHCNKHLPVGADGEFVWIESDGAVGPKVGT